MNQSLPTSECVDESSNLLESSSKYNHTNVSNTQPISVEEPEQCSNDDIDLHREHNKQTSGSITKERDFDLSAKSLDPSDGTDAEHTYKSLLNVIMVTLILVFYVFVQFLPYMISDIVNSSQQAPAVSVSQTSVPSDGPLTVYQSARHAEPFFRYDSVVYDSYNGDLKPAGRAVEEEGYVFVMYYASWSARSMLAREQFEKAAQLMRGRVPFVAINCFYPSSQCRSRYHFYSFPSFYVYASGMDMGFAFSGIEKSHYFVRFIQSLLNPITHIYNSSQLHNFISNQESSLVGYFNLSAPEPAGRFQQFYYASLRSIEKDFIQPVRFGVLSDQNFASKYSMNDNNNLLLVRSVKDNLAYPSNGNFTSTAISTWVNKYQVKPIVKWLFPRGKKSLELYKILQAGPTVILFTPYDACSVYNSGVSLLREVALDYFSHNVTNESRSKLSTFIAGSVNSRRVGAGSLCVVCKQKKSSQSECCYSLPSSRTCQVCISQAPCGGRCTHCQRIKAPIYNPHSSRLTRVCQSLKQDVFSTSNNEICCLSAANPLGRQFTDSYVLQHKDCVPVKSGGDSPVFSEDTRLSNDSVICTNNSTPPSFLAVDSTLYSALRKRFGIMSEQPANHLALVNLTDESYYVMKGQFNKSNIIDFLERFTTREITRERPSSPPKKSPMCTQSKSERIEVKDVNSHELENILSYKKRVIGKDVVVLFYSKWCLHCKALNHVFLSSANYLSKLTSIRFLRLDVSSNMLQWKHIVNRVPTITLFTDRGDTESLPQVKTVEELLRLILHHCSADHLIELGYRSPSIGISVLLPLLRSRITELERKLVDCETVSSEILQLELNNLLSQSKRHAKLLLLNFRKLYLHLYIGSLKSKFKPERHRFHIHSYKRR